jgi:hypothetical protein
VRLHSYVGWKGLAPFGFMVRSTRSGQRPSRKAMIPRYRRQARRGWDGATRLGEIIGAGFSCCSNDDHQIPRIDGFATVSLDEAEFGRALRDWTNNLAVRLNSAPRIAATSSMKERNIPFVLQRLQLHGDCSDGELAHKLAPPDLLVATLAGMLGEQR